MRNSQTKDGWLIPKEASPIIIPKNLTFEDLRQLHKRLKK